jgi:hypothetical protein
MHCERKSYVLQNRALALQIAACGERAEHKLLGDIHINMDSSPYLYER